MKRYFFLFLLFILCHGFSLREAKNNSYLINNLSFTTKERLEYRVHWGVINAGEAIITIDSTIHNLNRRPCYKITVEGNSTSAVDLVVPVRDKWQSYLDTAYMIPHQASRKIAEGNYTKNEVIQFDHFNNRADVKVWDKKKKKFKEPKQYPIPYGVQDIVSGYYFLRNIDYKELKTGEVITIKAFFENTIYDVQVIFTGKEVLKTKLGNFRCIKLKPIMPENKLFSGKAPITMWISDDKNKIPLKVKADLLVGAIEIDIKNFSGLRN